MLDLVGAELSSEERHLLLRPEVGGVIFFARNFLSRQQLAGLTAEISELRPELLLAVDQEGGRVQRMREGYSSLPAMQVLGDFYKKDEIAGSRLLRDTGWLMATEVIASGLDFSFAPVLDLDRTHCQVIGDRSFGDDPRLVSQAIKFFIEGMHEAGMAATGKHFPGHGGVPGDSHLETPCDKRDLPTLRDHDLQPFKILAPHLQAIMPAHIVFSNVDEQAVGFSRFWLQEVLRGELGFQGVVFSDDLSMKGADMVGGFKEKAAAALTAGCDMVLVCNNRAGALEVVNDLALQDHSADRVDLSTMKAKSVWTWATLEQNDRREATVDFLNSIVL
ncbi:MAG: beta-N-acetylhexosaminidase [Gammaproteobacteria bacterium]|nr:MAG: beta-N-acetylhexosaminidase [Gammaproteobacteria bacterium]RLA53512.1 MAG: beta-N-acetylhexosaminidase [Gammaproteobacteria bacterium]